MNKLILILVVLPFLCEAEHHHHMTTEDPESSHNHQHYTTNEPPVNVTQNPERSCWYFVSPDSYLLLPLHVLQDTAEITCTCFLQDIKENECPQWRGVYNTLHKITREISNGKCSVTLSFKDLNIPHIISCTDVTSDETRTTDVHINRGDYGELCKVQDQSEEYDSLCTHPYSCQGNYSNYGTCLCPKGAPIFINAPEKRCLPVARLSEDCESSIQCKATDLNSYCLRSDEYNTTNKCLCGPGYEEGNDGICEREDSCLNYVYHFSKRYYIVFYTLLAFSFLFILIGLVKICVLHRRAIAIRPGVVVSTRSEDSTPIVQVEETKDKNKF